jgi:nickel/cobalt transporter (NiCoT) family protein
MTVAESQAAVGRANEGPGRGLTRKERTELIAMALVVVGLLVLGTALLGASTAHHYRVSKTEVFGLGTGLLALTLGMRHAFDADHIAAIDNTTRKLMAEGKRPLGVGFFFSLGHSTVVFVLTLLLGLGIKSLGAGVADENSSLHHVTSLVGTSVSGLFLYAIAAINVVILWSILRAFGDLRSGEYDEAEVERKLEQRGMMNRFFYPLSRRVDKSWKMYPIGVLFGLGFDTATEIGLLVLSGSAVASGLPLWAILSLPLLFAGGMSFFDTLDGCFMNFAYHWAFSNPVRKIYYNLTVTGLSVAVAFGIGTIELVSLLGSELNLQGSFFSFFQNININSAGFVVVGLFVATWIMALVIWRVAKVEERFAPLAKQPAERS